MSIRDEIAALAERLSKEGVTVPRKATLVEVLDALADATADRDMEAGATVTEAIRQVGAAIDGSGMSRAEYATLQDIDALFE